MNHYSVRASGVTPRGGQPELLVNGERKAPLLYALSDIPGARPWLEPSKTSIAQFHDCGIDLLGVDTDVQSGWREDGSFDPAPALRELDAALASNPDAMLLIRLHLNAPYHWMHSHPHELIAFDTGESTDHGSYGDRVIQYDKFPEIKASIASKVWLHDAGDVLAQFCAALKAHPAGEHVAAIQPAYGLNGEWHQFMAAGGDRGEAMTAYYRDYCRKVYPDLGALRAVYGDGAEWDTLVLPTAAERDKTPRDQRAIDACKCLNLSVSDAIAYFARVLRENWPEILVGAFYGYYFSVGTVGSGMLEPQTLLNDPDIDFFAGPSAYNANKWPGNTPLLRYLPESMRLHGKLFLCEMDQGPESWGSNAKRGLGPSYKAKDEAEYAALLKRNILENLLRGHGAWYYDHRLPVWDIHEKHPYWNHPDRLALIRRLREFAEERMETPYVRGGDVLLVFDTESNYIGHSNTFHSDTFGVMDAFHKSGAAWDAVYLCDIGLVDPDSYRCVVFVNCPYVKEEHAEVIRGRIAGGGRTLVFSESFAGNLGGAAAFPADGCTVVVQETLPLDPSVWREIFRGAGAWIYSEGGEVLTAGHGLLMIHSLGKETSEIRLPCGTVTVAHPGGGADTAALDLADGRRLL